MSALRAIGQEFQVNQYTNSDQAAPNVAANPHTGGFQIVWQSDGQDGDGWGVFGQNFSNSGALVGAEISIADMTVGDQITPDVAFNEDGNGMWVWSTTAIYNSAASDANEPSIANTFPAANYRTSSMTFGFEAEAGTDQDYRNFERLRDGGWDDDPIGNDAIEPMVINLDQDMFISGWYRRDQDRGDFHFTLDQVSADFDQVISANGDYSRGFAEAETTGRTYTNFGDVAELRTVDTRFGDLREMLVVTTLASSLDARDGVIQFQIFQESAFAGLAFLYGTRLQTDYNDRFVLAESGLTGDASRPRVAVLDDGGFAIVWMEENQTSANQADWNTNVYVQVFGADLTATTPRIAVHDASNANQEVPEIVATNDGGFLVTWTDEQGDNNGSGVMAQRFDDDGIRLGEAMVVNSSTQGDQTDAAVAVLTNGDVVVTWESSVGDASGSGINAQLLAIDDYGPNTAQYLVGTTAGDSLEAGALNDTIFGGGGNDLIFSRLSNDIANGGDGFDTIHAGEGSDTVDGGNGRDLVFLNQGNDIYFDNGQGGELGRDTVFGGFGNDTIQGGNGDDSFYGGEGNDLTFARLGNDLVNGGDGFDTIHAGEGNDTVDGGNGRDLVFLNQGNDIYFDNGQGGELGRDTVYAGFGNDTVEGGNGDDSFFGEAGNDQIFARLGNDLVNGGDGFDSIYAGDGNDTVDGGNGRDLVFLGQGNDIYFDNGQGGELGRDTVYGGFGNDTVQGGNGNDTFFGDAGNDSILARLGNDTVFGGDGFDFIDAGDGNDLVFAGNGTDTVLLGNGNDVYVDTAQAGALGQDTITGGAGADQFQFQATMSADVITDFQIGIDDLRLTQSLWGGGRTEAQVVNDFASVTAAGVLLDFGNNQSILLQGLNSTAGLDGDILLV